MLVKVLKSKENTPTVDLKSQYPFGTLGFNKTVQINLNTTLREIIMESKNKLLPWPVLDFNEIKDILR